MKYIKNIKIRLRKVHHLYRIEPETNFLILIYLQLDVTDL